MADTIIESLRDYIATCQLFAQQGYLLNVNWVDPTAKSYGIFPLPGDKVVEPYLNGGGMCEYPFAIQVNESNSDDIARLETQGFFEKLGDWLDEQDDLENYPTLSSNLRPFEIETLGQGYLVDQGESNVSTYEVPCKLTYERT